jgi:predicted translin family RNA/ssDNA-binding protein
MRHAVDVETLEVFEHELAAFERAGVADLERQRTRNVAAASALVAETQARQELIRRALDRAEADIRRADEDVERLEAKLAGHDPDFHTYA